VTFTIVSDLAEGAAGRAPARSAPAVITDRPRPPRLTEPWFC
jgi:hypothetical protein